MASELRIWVDKYGKFSVEASVESVDEENVSLKRKDGGKITVAIKQLSEEDKDFLAELAARKKAAGNPLRLKPRQQRELVPLPVLDLPAATETLADYESLQLSPATTVAIPEFEPSQLAADPSPKPTTIQEANIRIFDVDVYDDCSRPIPVITVSDSGKPITSIAMSINRGKPSPGQQPKNQLVRFDIDQQQAYVALNHNEPIRLLDHHADSSRSLVLTGFNSLGNGGQLAVATGWGPSGVELSQMRTIGQQNQDVRVASPEMRWARWIDDEHVLAVIDDTWGLWNIISGRNLYRFNGMDHRSAPALSSGRRYLAVPIKGAVVLYETKTGKPLGRIAVERQFPGVAFSPQSDRLAIATSRRMRCWDLTTASLSDEVASRPIQGSKSPIWVDSDLILSSSGVLMSLFRGIPIWQYDIATVEIASIGDHVAIFRKQSTSELSCTTIPHPGALNAIEWLDSGIPEINSDAWRLLGRSQWRTGAWVDDNVRMSANGDRRR
jgi:hypothetical protein